MDPERFSPSPGPTEENSSTETTAGSVIDSGIVHSRGSTFDHSDSKENPESSLNLFLSHREEIDVVGLDHEGDVAPASSNDVLRGPFPNSRDSGVCLNETSSPAAKACASPQRWTKPENASSPKSMWRPWFKIEEDMRATPPRAHEANIQPRPLGYPFDYQTGYLLAQREMLLRMSQQYSGVVSYFNGMSPMGGAAPFPFPQSAYPVMSTPVAGYFGHYAPSFNQYQVPQVAATTAAHSSFFKRAAPIEHSSNPPAKRLFSSPQDNRDIQPVAEMQANIPQPAQSVAGIVLAPPPPDALPPRISVRGRRKVAKDESHKTTSDNCKKREKPPPYGDHELHEATIHFEDSLLKNKYCDSNGNYRVPKVPDSHEEKEALRHDLLELFRLSNLPRVPLELQTNVDALAHYPHMQHLISLYIDGVDLDSLHYGAFGQAFCNPRLAAVPEEEINASLDKMSYLGADGMLHCRVVKTNGSGAVCDHVTKELGKMRRHAKNHYPEKKWVCCFCRAQMPDMTDMERHTSTHSVLKPFKCPACLKVFSQKVTLNQHLKSIHDVIPEAVDPRKSLVCRQHGLQFLEHEREACLRHLELHHDQTDDFKNRKKRSQFPYDV